MSKNDFHVLKIHQIKENHMAYTLDTTVGDILKDTKAVETLEKYVPGISTNPMLGLAKGMTLKSLLDMPQAKQAGITEKMVLQVLAEINARK
jgi:hypothetical protein